MSLDEKSRAYDPGYMPTKTLEQLVAENPTNQCLADRLADHLAVSETKTYGTRNSNPPREA